MLSSHQDLKETPLIQAPTKGLGERDLSILAQTQDPKDPPKEPDPTGDGGSSSFRYLN